MGPMKAGNSAHTMGSATHMTPTAPAARTFLPKGPCCRAWASTCSPLCCSRATYRQADPAALHVRRGTRMVQSAAGRCRLRMAHATGKHVHWQAHHATPDAHRLQSEGGNPFLGVIWQLWVVE